MGWTASLSSVLMIQPWTSLLLRKQIYIFYFWYLLLYTLFRDSESPNLRKRQDEFWWFMRRRVEGVNTYKSSSPGNECPVPFPNMIMSPWLTQFNFIIFFLNRQDVTVYPRLTLNSWWSSCLIPHIFYNYSIASVPPAQYVLVGALGGQRRMVIHLTEMLAI